MKLRLQPGSLRVRLSESEMPILADAGFLEETLTLAPGHVLRYRLELADVPQATCRLSNSTLQVCIPEREGRAWAASQEIAMPPAIIAQGAELIVERDLDRTKKR